MHPLSSFGIAVRRATTLERLALVGKTALAATLAWGAGRLLLPEQIAEYAYYAPFGAVLAMTPTLSGSIKSGIQTAIGVAFGIAVAWVLIFAGAPIWVAVPATVGVCTLLAGLFTPGPARDYVPVAALFVIVAGGRDAEDYSAGYLVQLVLGLVIGVAINISIAPPLRIKAAFDGIELARRRVAETLRQWADDPEEDTESGLENISEALESASIAIEDARQSSRGNPRIRWNRYDAADVDSALRALRRAHRLTTDVADLLQEGRDRDERLRGVASDALRSVSDVWADSAEPDDALDAVIAVCEHPAEREEARDRDWASALEFVLRSLTRTAHYATTSERPAAGNSGSGKAAGRIG